MFPFGWELVSTNRLIECVQNKWDAAVQQYDGVTAVEHENYKPYLVDFDIAVIRLPTAIKYNDYVQPICLPSSPVAVGTDCVITGWGATLGQLSITFGFRYIRFTVADKLHGA